MNVRINKKKKMHPAVPPRRPKVLQPDDIYDRSLKTNKKKTTTKNFFYLVAAGCAVAERCSQSA
jgi:hypothetical protein